MIDVCAARGGPSVNPQYNMRTVSKTGFENRLNDKDIVRLVRLGQGGLPILIAHRWSRCLRRAGVLPNLR